MDVLVIGGGGREHALVWALKRSASVDRLFCSPGNAGIAADAECWDLAPGDLKALAHAADDHAVDLVVVGPEAPLTAGIVEVFDTVDIPCFGPRRSAAIVEGSKAFSKAFMQRHAIPTAPFDVFSSAAAAIDFAQRPPWGYPSVVKADGLAAGKGVIVCQDANEAEAAIRSIMERRSFGAAGDAIVIEECLAGQEVSLMALSDGERVLPLVPAQDHKQVGDGDTGPNTGGMGAFAPSHEVLDAARVEELTATILQPTIVGLAAEDRAFSGVIYAGLMLTADGPMVLEYNCRFGDPEAQAILPLLDADLGELLAGIAEGSAPERPLRWSGRHCACVILSAAGYPEKPRLGDPISGLQAAGQRDDLFVFHAGTAREGDDIVTSGGRVLGVTAVDDTLEAALARAYAGIDDIHFEGMHYRTDIGRRQEVRT